MIRPCVLISLFLLYISLLAAGCASGPEPSREPADANWAQYEVDRPLESDEIETRAFYLTMRDGTKIAVDLHLPAEREAGQRFPAIIRPTRYHRAMDFRWPASIKYEQPHEVIRLFLGNGYAWLDIDARGSGASFGNRRSPWGPEEVADYAEVLDWIVAQDWADGNVGGTGGSYDGTAAEMAASTGHPAMKAVAPLFSLYDAYEDIGFPGGINLAHFTSRWAISNDALDRDAMDELVDSALARWAIVGVKPVDDDSSRAQLREAVASHRYNYDIHALALRTWYRDDFADFHQDLAFDIWSPYGHAETFRRTKIPIYSWSGWWDGAYAHAAIRRFLNVPTPNHKLVIGPWNHGGNLNIDPANPGASQFQMGLELLRFFDRHLKGIENGIDAEPAVHYYTMVEEKWKVAETWPPAAERVDFYLGEGGRLSEAPPNAETGADRYVVDYRTRTPKETSRWNSLLGDPDVIYPDRAREDEKLLVYETAPLEEDTEVTGHPVVELFVASDQIDGQFIAYLEDVAPDGTVQYVTEGQLRGLMRAESGQGLYADAPGVPVRKYLRAEGKHLRPGEIEELHFDLVPTSYLFRSGHRIRIALAGADRDHFYLPLFEPPTFDVQRNAPYPSKVTLPIVER